MRHRLIYVACWIAWALRLPDRIRERLTWAYLEAKYGPTSEWRTSEEVAAEHGVDLRKGAK